jgi:DNA polymerase III alpha subunit (gram-positive type)
MKLPKEYIIVEIIPSHSNSKYGFIVQLQALKIKEDKIIDRLDLRVNEDLINNPDLVNMISYDEEMFTYVNDKEDILKDFIKFIGKDKLLIIDNYYTLDYLSTIKNKKESVFKYLDLELSDDVFDKIMKKYKLEPSNHLVDLLYEAIIFEKESK